MYTYRTKGTCSRAIDLELDGDILSSVSFHGGCPGNLAAISKLVVGMPADTVVELLEGNTCGNKPTSCADQLTRAIRAAQSEQNA